MDIVECPYCHTDLPWDGPEGVFRHLLITHPETSRSRAVFLALTRLPLPRDRATTPLPPQRAASGGGRGSGFRPSPTTRGDAAGT
jgi:hypothetical protein